MDKKPVLKYYKLGKQKIEYDNCYRNNSHSAFLAKSRKNFLQLEEHKGRGNQNYDTTCKLCGEEEEDIAHFLVKCKELEGERDSRLMNGTQQSTEEKLVQLLFENKEHQEVGKMIKKLWMTRNRIKEDLRPP